MSAGRTGSKPVFRCANFPVVKVAAAQIACALGDVEANLAKIREVSARAKVLGVELIVFPEASDTGYSMPVISKHAKPWTEGAVPALKKMAKEFSLTVVCGVSERDGDRVYNSQVFIDPHGEILASYRKTHLFVLAPNDESTCYTPGDKFVSVPANGFHFGLSICYDLRFPEAARALALQHGANVLLVSSAWPLPRVEHLRALAIARAIENQSYLVLANRTGVDAGVTCCGTSAISIRQVSCSLLLPVIAKNCSSPILPSKRSRRRGIRSQCLRIGAQICISGLQPVWGAHACSVLVAAFCGDELRLRSIFLRRAPTNPRSGSSRSQNAIAGTLQACAPQRNKTRVPN
jgi:omega-amidase